ncbi:XapX domain-containing protein [Paenibacillus albiflavus]|uniref:XapX domain-containing protein n=1 Tax=Paenibacillus albiflavus TaxID=2545760 RepID=A0A4R4EKF8_9BACL|nr:DUF1427 family protein [Paenibacillus albiflavus]TCZ78881.1 XapX domain-containing protein [Paenibacillus albiflavus]
MKWFNAKETIYALLTGVIVGGLFKLLDFPLPAPPNFEAFMGVLGAWIGMVLARKLSKKGGN